ncbi:hypothetical protein F2Q69_00022186 [Brassica cretica]|uniref:Uncharacterized protein n=1 Tax=Brassica cretica TaxID=69181 RepID=A0A8S9Q150_BRACR|nr:hypothetical protein F2Q69_00022186 [Brassica cretica]
MQDLLRLLPAEEVKLSTENPSFTATESSFLYKDKGDSALQTIPATLSSNDESFKFQRGFLGAELRIVSAPSGIR